MPKYSVGDLVRGLPCEDPYRKLLVSPSSWDNCVGKVGVIVRVGCPFTNDANLNYLVRWPEASWYISEQYMELVFST